MKKNRGFVSSFGVSRRLQQTNTRQLQPGQGRHDVRRSDQHFRHSHSL